MAANGDRFPRIARAASAFAIVLGLGALLGWVLNVPILVSLVPGLVSMKPNTAVALVSAGAALQLQIEPSGAPWQRRMARACALLTCALGALTLMEYLSGANLGIDQLLIHARLGETATSHPGRMAPNTALCFLLLGTALFLLDQREKLSRATTQALAAAVLLATLVASAGYAFNVAVLYRLAEFTAMAAHTAVGLATLSVGVLVSRPRAASLRFLDWPLRAKMALLLIVASVVPLGIAALGNTQSAAKQLEEATGALLAARADHLAAELDGYNRSEQRSVDELARAVAAIGCCDGLAEGKLSVIHALLATRPASESIVHGAAILDMQGRVRFATEARLEGHDLSYRAYVRAGELGVAVVSDVHVAGEEGANLPMIAYLAPVRRPDGTLAGLAVIWTYAAGVWDLMKRSNELSGPGSFAVMFDNQGIRIAHTYSTDIVFHPGGPLVRETIDAAVAERRFGNRTEALLREVRAFPEQFERARADSPDPASFRGFAPVNQEWCYGVARRLETAPWTVFYMTPERNLLAQVARSTRRQAVFASMVIVFALLVGTLFALVILAPIRSLSDATEQLARGQSGARVRFLRDDEVGKLGASFNRMADRLELQAAELRQSNDDLEERVRRRTVELAASEQNLAITLESIGDAVIVTDPKGRIVRMNKVAEQLTGWSLSEALARPLEDVFRIVGEDTRAPVPSPAERVLREGVVVGLANHTILLARDGSECPIADSAAPIVDSNGGVRGVVLVFRDVHAERVVENALRESEAKYRELYEGLPDMCVTVDVQSEMVVECNETLAGELGYSKGEILGRPVNDLYAPEVLAPRSNERLQFQQSGELHDRERVLRRKDGTRLEVSLSVVAGEGPGGRLQAKAVWRDISARKQAERDRQFVAELAELQALSSDALDLMAQIAERLALHLNVARAAFVEIDVGQGRITIQRDFHRGSPSVAGTFDLSAHSSETAAEQRAGNTIVLADTMSDPRTASRFETAYKRIGTRSSVSVPLIRDGQWIASLAVSDTQPRAWQEREVALIQSVAERGWLWIEYSRLAAALRKKKAQGLLQRSEDRFRLLIEGVKEYAIFRLDPQGLVVSWNGGAERLKGYAEAEIVGKHFSVFYTPDEIATAHPEELLRRAAAEGRCEEEGWRVRKDGSRFWASVLISPLYDVGGALEGFAKVTRDYTERRRTEQVLHQRQAELTASLEERDVLLKEVHHRVKNNLQVIASLINLQRRRVNDTSSRKALEECKARVEAIALIHEKLYQSKDYANVPFSEYAKSLAANIFYAAGTSPSISLEVNVEAVSLPVDKAIPCGLALNELMTNALKHAFPAERSGTIRVELRKLDGQVFLAVTDDGIGMQTDLDPAQTKSLGMQLVSELVAQLRGQLEIVRNRGTSFRITFPLPTTS